VDAAKERKSINWLTAIVMVIYHVLAVDALFTSRGRAWPLLRFCVGLHLAWHWSRLPPAAHTPRVPLSKWLEYFFAICGTLALEGGPIFWVGIHRIHHQLTDREGDPHSPRTASGVAHGLDRDRTGAAQGREAWPYVPDLRRDKFYHWLSKYHWVTQLWWRHRLLLLGWNVALWAVFLRTVVDCTSPGW